MISSDAEVNDELLLKILQRGHSRLPVYEGNNKQVRALRCSLPCWLWGQRREFVCLLLCWMWGTRRERAGRRGRQAMQHPR